MKRTQFDQHDIELIESRCVYDGVFQVNKVTFSYQRFDGTKSEPIEREVFERGHSVGILLFDPIKDAVVLIEQLRIATLSKTAHPWQLEIVAGGIDGTESALNCAKREVMEETGLSPSNVMQMFKCWLSPGGSSEQMTFFIASVDSSLAQGVHGKAEENEDIRVMVYPFDKVLHMCQQNELQNSPTLLAVQWLGLNHDKVVSDWT